MKSNKHLKVFIIATFTSLLLLTILSLCLILFSYFNINRLFINEIDDALEASSKVKEVNDLLYSLSLSEAFKTDNIDLINMYLNMQISGMFFVSIYFLLLIIYFSFWVYSWITKNSLYLDTHKEIYLDIKKWSKEKSRKIKTRLKKFKKILRKIK